MFRQTKQHGFTIIEVVITIAIGAAVMALVLNAVAGARRSQRNNARASDVNQVAAGVNQYIAIRNKLPECFNDIAGIIDDGEKFGHYSQNQTLTACGTDDTGTISINPAKSITATIPTKQGDFPTFIALVGTAVAGNIHFDEVTAADKVVVMRETGCNGTDDVEQGGIREMAILYRLEGQDDIICLEI